MRGTESIGSFAKRIRIEPIRILLWENSYAFPSPMELLELAKTLHISVDELLDFAVENPSKLKPRYQYCQLGVSMQCDMMVISNELNSKHERLLAVSHLHDNLVYCTKDVKLDALTALYRDTKPSTAVNVGYDQVAVTRFVRAFVDTYSVKIEYQYI